MRGLIFDLQRFCLHDGPGIRTTVFLKGCPLSCAWCHNPESLSPRPEVSIQPDRCIACGDCVDACHAGVPKPGAGRGAENVELCLVCGDCVDACPTLAREVAGREVEAEELIREVSRDRIFFDDSGGGVTFSGGEPLYQIAFLLEALELCRERGLRTAVDTSGLALESDLLAVAELADLFLFDLKIVDASRHRELTGVDNRRILENLATLAGRNVRIWLRIPVLPGVNDDENIEESASIAARYPAVEKVCLLPYHRIGEGKRNRLGMPVPSESMTSPDASHMATLAARFEACGVRTQIGG